jgi:tetratricopeptide (TPR) repeat protein
MRTIKMLEKRMKKVSENQLNLIFASSGWIFGFIGIVIGVWGFSNSIATQSRSDFKETIDLYYETAKLLDVESSGPDSFSLWHVRGQQDHEDFDSIKVWKNIRKLEALSDDPEPAIALKFLFISKLKDEREIEKYIDEIGSEIGESEKLFYLGLIISKDRDRIETALNYMKQATLLEPENVEMRSIYALNLHSANRNDEAIEQFRIAMENDSSNTMVINKLGHVLVESRKFDEAELLLSDAVKNDVADTGTFNVLGYSYVIQRDFKQAKRYFELSIEKDFLNPLPHRNLSLVLRELGDLENAEKEAFLAKKYGWAVPEGADYRSVMD